MSVRVTIVSGRSYHLSDGGVLAGIGTTHFLIRFNSVSGSFDSTQLMTRNGFTGLDSDQLILKMDFFNLIQIDSRLKSFQNFDSNQLTTQKKFLESYSNQLVTQ